MPDQIKKNLCLRCDFVTNHIVLYSVTKISDNEDFDYREIYEIVKCSGCERISFRDEFINLEDIQINDDNEWHPSVTIETYPAKLKVKKKLDDAYVLPTKIKIVYEEAINAFNAGCFLLTGVAFRAIIEAICLDKNIVGRDLAKKIDNLVKQKLITDKEAQRLHSIRFLGNDSVHEMKVPDNAKLLLVLSIVEHLLNNLYIIDYQTKNHLETIITKFAEFEELLDYSLNKYELNDEIPLGAILGKSYRRLNGKISDFETQLKEKIKSGEYSKLEIGEIDVYGSNPIPTQLFKKVIYNNG